MKRDLLHVRPLSYTLFHSSWVTLVQTSVSLDLIDNLSLTSKKSRITSLDMAALLKRLVTF